GADERAAQEREREQRDEDDVGGTAERRVRREDRHLDDRGDEDQQHRLDRVEHQRAAVLAFGFGIRTTTDCSEPRSTNGCTWICLKRSMSFCPALVTVPIRIPRGKTDGSSPLPGEPAVITVSPISTCLSFVTRARVSDSVALPCWSR